MTDDEPLDADGKQRCCHPLKPSTVASDPLNCAKHSASTCAHDCVAAMHHYCLPAPCSTSTSTARGLQAPELPIKPCKVATILYRSARCYCAPTLRHYYAPLCATMRHSAPLCVGVGFKIRHPLCLRRGPQTCAKRCCKRSVHSDAAKRRYYALLVAPNERKG